MTDRQSRRKTQSRPPSMQSTSILHLSPGIREEDGATPIPASNPKKLMPATKARAPSTTTTAGRHSRRVVIAYADSFWKPQRIRPIVSSAAIPSPKARPLPIKSTLSLAVEPAPIHKHCSRRGMTAEDLRRRRGLHRGMRADSDTSQMIVGAF